MKLFYNKVFKNCFLITVTLFLSEILFRVIVQIPIIDFSIIRAFLGISILAWIFGTLFTFFKRQINNFFVFLFCAIFTFYGFIQVGCFFFFRNFLSLSSFFTIFKEKESLFFFISDIPLFSYLLLIPLLFLVFFLLFIDKKVQILEWNDKIDFSDKFDSSARKEQNEQSFYKKRKKSLFSNRLGALFVLLLSSSLFYLTLIVPFLQNQNQIKSTLSLFLNPEIPNIAIQQFGYSAYGILDIKNSLFPYLKTDIESKYQYEYQKKEQVPSAFTRYMDDSLWEKELDSELNRKYKLLGNYFISQEITDKNNYTGLFKDKNLIFMMVDSIDYSLLQEEYFPNFNELYTKSWSFENAYSINSPCAMDNELVSMVSLFPISSYCSSTTYQNNEYPESLFSLFKKEEYETSVFYNFYDKNQIRNKIYANLGASSIYDVSNLGISFKDSYGEWSSDRELIRKVLEITEEEKRFMTFITSPSTSSPYNTSSEIGDIHLESFQNTGYDLKKKRYFSKLKEFDLALGDLIEGLKRQEKLDDTVIIILGNHTPNGVSLSNDLGKRESIPFLIYNTNITSTKDNKFVSTINMVPTIANLFDLEYDPRRYAGEDIFSNSYENRVYFADSSWMDSKAYFNAISGKVLFFKANDKYNLEELEEIRKNLYLRISMSNLAIKTNYYQYLYDKFEEYKVPTIQ